MAQRRMNFKNFTKKVFVFVEKMNLLTNSSILNISLGHFNLNNFPKNHNIKVI